MPVLNFVLQTFIVCRITFEKETYIFFLIRSMFLFQYSYLNICLRVFLIVIPILKFFVAVLELINLLDGIERQFIKWRIINVGIKKKKQKTKRYLVAYEKLAVPCYSAPNSSLKLVLLLLVHIVPADYCMQRRGILKWILRIGTVIKNQLLVF